jgi:hypothetical protein
MAITTYAQLQTALGNWLVRSGETETTSRAPEWISLFEGRFKRKVRVREMEQRSTASLNGRYLALPTSPDAFLSMRALKINTDPVRVLEPVSPDYLWTFYGSSATGKPKVFSVIGSEIAFGPIPDSTDTVEMSFYQFDVLSDANTTNWLLTAYPDIYLYGSLCEAEPYFGNDARFPMWKARLDEAMAELTAADMRDRWSGGALTMRSDTGNP